MRTELKERETDRFTVEDDAEVRYTVSERTEFTRQIPAEGPAGEAMAGAVRYVCAGLPITRLASGQYELQTDPPKVCRRID